MDYFKNIWEQLESQLEEKKKLNLSNKFLYLPQNPRKKNVKSEVRK